MITHPFLDALLAAAALAACCRCQQEGAQGQASPREQVVRALAEAGAELDPKARTLTVPCKVNRRADLLEYVLIHKMGKIHEALLTTEVRPSLLNAGLIALNLTPGKNATYKEKDPPPTEEEVRAGADYLTIFPPEGTDVWMTVAYTDADGERVEQAVEDWIIDLSTEKTLRGARWIFLGGRMAPPYRGEPEVFLADLEGNLVSNCYLTPANHLVTIRHERGRDDQNWWWNEPLCPPPDTPVELTFHCTKPAVVADREARLEKEGAPEVKKPGELPAPPASGDRRKKKDAETGRGGSPKKGAK